MQKAGRNGEAAGDGGGANFGFPAWLAKAHQQLEGLTSWRSRDKSADIRIARSTARSLLPGTPDKVTG